MEKWINLSGRIQYAHGVAPNIHSFDMRSGKDLSFHKFSPSTIYLSPKSCHDPGASKEFITELIIINILMKLWKSLAKHKILVSL